MKRMKYLPLVVALLAVNLGSASAGQPHMQDALGHLRSARTALQQAERNKGGHRERALNLVNKAISEVEAGIAYAR